MISYQCDKCRRHMNFEEKVAIRVGFAYGGGVELCPNCAAPILQILKKADLLPERTLKKLPNNKAVA